MVIKRFAVVGQVKQRPAKFGGENFASELNGASHPGGSSALITGATGVIRSPFRDRSTLLACDTNSDWAMSPDWDGAARSETTKFIARPIMATADNPTTVRLKLPRDARSQGIGLFACRSPRVSMLSASAECTCARSGRSDKLALVIVSMTDPPMVNEGNVAAGRLRRCDGRHRFAVLRGPDGSLPLAASRRSRCNAESCSAG
jgi:hypothetical protein